jgi:hypothetical protein
MILDALLEFSDAQAVTASAISTNVIDLGPVTDNVLRDIGTGEGVYFCWNTNITATDSGSDATLTIALVSDSTVNLATSPTTHYSTGAMAFATFATAGTRGAVRLPAGDYEQYLGVSYTVASGPLTAGAFDAFLTRDPQVWRTYAKRYVNVNG